MCHWENDIYKLPELPKKAKRGRPECDIPGCHKKAPFWDIFCKDHRISPKEGGER